MKNRQFTSFLLIVVILTMLSAPVFANSMNHSALYKLDGTINLEKQAGHLCNTGAEIMQTIMGTGTMDKSQTVALVPGKISMDDQNDWVAGVSALTVTTVIELCAPPKTLVDGDQELDIGTDDIISIQMPPILSLFMDSLVLELGEEHSWAFADGDVISPYHPAVLADLVEVEKLTQQIWAVQVQADPGFSGELNMDMEAANGPYDDHYVWYTDPYNMPWLDMFPYEGPTSGWAIFPVLPWSTVQQMYQDMMGLMDNSMPITWQDLVLAYSDLDGADDSWWYDEDGKIKVGKDFVGSYFNIEQFARTSQGTMKRYIDISSPFSHGYLSEDVIVVGKSQVEETFSMMNIKPGSDMPGKWWDLF